MVDTGEAQYYEQLAQHRGDIDPQLEHQPNMSAHQEPPEHHELHQLQRLQEPPAPPQQQDSRPPVSADELQLAAQLTQGLEPMMAAAAVQDQAQEQQPMSQQEAQMQQQPDAEQNLQEQLEASLQNHDHDLQNQRLQDVLPHQGQPQPDHYPHDSPAPPHLSHHMPMEPLPMQQQYQQHGATPPRKRSKVSRACDECRRKKIKCNAPADSSVQACANCQRSHAACLFSRIPQKRGPSKGYIKELADRINTIEGKLNTTVDGLDRRASAEAFATPGLGDESRKRPFASISGDGFAAPSPNRMPAYASEHRQILPYVQPDFRPAPTAGTPNDLVPKPLAPAQIPGATNGLALQDHSEMMEGMSQSELPQGPGPQADHIPEIDDTAFNCYLEVVHPTFPLLASTKARVQSLFWQIPPAIQSAFHNAFLAMVNPFLPASDSQANGDPATACRLLSEWEAGHKAAGSTITDLVRLQTLIMAAIAVDCHGIAYSQGQLGGLSKAEILGRAVGLAYSMKLFARQVDLEPNPELDPNSDDNVALRAWWVLIMLDRWNAAGMGMPALISNDSVAVDPGLRLVAGEVVFSLIHISHVLGHIVPVAINPVLDPFAPAGSTLISMSKMSTGMLPWILPSPLTEPMLLLAYWHARLISELLAPRQNPANVLQATRNLVQLLGANYKLVSPLTHHFIALAALGLLQLRQMDESRDEADRLINDVLEFSMAPSPWNDAVRAKLAEHLPRPGTAASAAADGQNLHQLADMAAAKEGSVPAADADGAHGGPKEEPLASGDDGPAPDVDLGQAERDRVAGGASGGNLQPPANVDVRALLRAGYLTWFEEPVEDGLAE
ncbi:uncharacterized protein THITE_2037048 [Thermothielavioides terrestris NRRL 8126]|uniref:Zn(2)-C6 fungal-type domain-containing protein n=1 Tax=Thermothielavioides terrestris (strain ATCC 38088 / NRRL 8126) TaxID=578455 RepID=G2QSQ6_THETT|nr:uncharacterized protein THITE_2037048 [Thermothielavioides terrestris NRRL 8126]AEO64339.1 hypothetical protein THITE_2037048 [Thermothielavioides terrestris NRRL 8126]